MNIRWFHTFSIKTIHIYFNSWWRRQTTKQNLNALAIAIHVINWLSENHETESKTLVRNFIKCFHPFWQIFFSNVHIIPKCLLTFHLGMFNKIRSCLWPDILIVDKMLWQFENRRKVNLSCDSTYWLHFIDIEALPIPKKTAPSFILYVYL